MGAIHVITVDRADPPTMHKFYNFWGAEVLESLINAFALKSSQARERYRGWSI